MKHDIIIIGGGPAGAMAALLAAKKGLDALLVEKNAREKYKPCSGIYPLHNFRDVPEVPESVFERDQVTMRTISATNDALMDAREFNLIMGKIILRSKFDEYMVSAAEKDGATILEESSVKKIDVTKDNVSVAIDEKGGPEKVVDADMLFLATGASGKKLHDQLGLEFPNTIQGLIAEYESSSDHVENVLSSGAYHIYLNKKYSRAGHFWITCREDTFNAGFIDTTVNKSTFDSIITKDPKIKPLFDDAKEKCWPGRDKHYTVAQIPVHPISTPYRDRVLVLGDAAGLTHRFYFEGVWQGRLSAKLAMDVVSSLREREMLFTAENLSEYKKLLARNIVNKFNRSGKKNNWVFREARNDDELWGFFCETVKKNRAFRKLIIQCYEADYTKTGDKLDTRAGEMIFGTIPLLKKITYAPLFLKAAGMK